MSEPGMGSESQIATNDMFQKGSGYMNFYSHRTKETVSQAIYQLRWWEHQKVGISKMERKFIWWQS